MEQSNLMQIAGMAAKFRGDHRDNGTATRAIRHWVLNNKTQDDLYTFDLLYRVAWRAEKRARRRFESNRPEDKHRPCVGGRPMPRTIVRDYDNPLAVQRV